MTGAGMPGTTGAGDRPHLLGKAVSLRDRGRVDAWIAIDKLHGWGRTSIAAGTPAGA